jgi:hypothetical protein
VSKEPQSYCAYYCEENIWHLCADERLADCERRVLIISNPARRVAMWGQKICPDPDMPIAWDYHVILLARRPGQAWQAWDLDAREPGPRPAKDWLHDSFRAIGLLPPQFEPRFRMVTCADYRRYLRSDRRHMLHVDGSPKQPPPSWAPIMGECPPGAVDDGSNLERFLDTEDGGFLGELFRLSVLRRWLG